MLREDDDGSGDGLSKLSGKKRPRVEYGTVSDRQNESEAGSSGVEVLPPVVMTGSPGIVQTGGNLNLSVASLNPSSNGIGQAGGDFVGINPSTALPNPGGLMRGSAGFVGDGSGSLSYPSDVVGGASVGGWNAIPEQRAWPAGGGVQATTTATQDGSGSWGGSWTNAGVGMQSSEGLDEEGEDNQQEQEDEESEGEGPFSDEEEGEVFLPGK